jgi:hypothetical protein
MVTWLCHLFGPLLQNFIQRFHVTKAYIDVSRALDQALNPFVTSSSFSHGTPFHIWAKETAAQKEIDDYNGAHEMNAQIEWELETGMRRLNVNRNPSGRKPTWKYTAAR